MMAFLLLEFRPKLWDYIITADNKLHSEHFVVAGLLLVLLTRYITGKKL